MFNKKLIKNLNDSISFINSARINDDITSKCGDLFKSLNRLWNINPDKTDTKSFKHLLSDKLNPDSKKIISNSVELRSLVYLEPQILNHWILNKNRYDPNNLQHGLISKAREEHKRLLDSFQLWASSRTEPKLLEDLLDNLTVILYIVRSNIFHGEKTPNGPDINKNERDRIVCSKTLPLLELLLDLLLYKPSLRLAVYGTLDQSGNNSHLLSSISGVWLEGEVEGDIELRNGLRYFRWNINNHNHKIQVFESEQLKERLAVIDTFEGKSYRRILVPVFTEEGVIIANVYADNLNLPY